MKTRWTIRLASLLLTGITGIAAAQVMEDGRLDFGFTGLPIPPATKSNQTRPRTVQLLIEAYSVKTLTIAQRVQYLQEIGACRMEAGMPTLRAGFKDADASIRAEAIRSAAAIANTTKTLDKLANELSGMFPDEKDAAVRREILLATIGASPFRRISSAVQNGLGDEDLNVKLAAIQAAGSLDDADAIAGKMPTWPVQLQVQALASLGRLQATKHAPTIAGMLNGEVAVKCAALQSLRAMKAMDQMPAAAKLLADAHPIVRRNAVLALIDLADAPARNQQALRMLADPDPTVRQAAVRLVATSWTIDAVAPVVKQLADEYRPLHDTAKSVLPVKEPADVRQACIDAAVQLIGSSNPRRQEDGSYILGELKSNAGIEQHIALLNLSGPAEIDPDLIAQAAKSLGQIADQRAKEAILKIALSEPGGITDTAANKMVTISPAIAEAIIAAGRLKAVEVMPAVATTLNTNIDPMNPSPYLALKSAAAWAYGMIGSPTGPLAERLVTEMNVLGLPDRDRAEMAKALGNLLAKDALGPLKQAAESSPEVKLKWAAHWAVERITGETTPYEPPVEDWKADVSIQDLREK